MRPTFPYARGAGSRWLSTFLVALAAPAFGFNEEWTRGDGSWSRPGHAQRMMDAARSAGASTARLTVDWSYVQPRGPGDWDIGRLRELHGRLVAAGQRPVLVLVGAPCWAAHDICRGEARPLVRGAVPAAIRPARESLGAWERFAGRVARELPGARAFEVWNEPNLPQFWGTPRPERDHARFAELVRRASVALRAQAPGTPVLVGGIAAGDEERGLAAPWARYAAKVYGHGIALHSDGLALHPYPAFRGPGSNHAANTLAKVDTARLLLRLADPGDTSLAVSEFGLPGRGREQAAYLVEVLAGLRARPDVPIALWHRLQDDSDAGFALQASAGLIRDDPGSTPKLAWCALSGGCR